MRAEIRRRPWLLAPVVLLVVLAVQACVAPRDQAGSANTSAAEPPRPSVNHAAHLQRELACIDCHDPDETGDPKLPSVETCWDCHEQDMAEEPERVQAYFAFMRQPDGSFKFPKLAYSPDLKFVHGTHIENGAECKDCHGEPAETTVTRPPLLDLKASCMNCHEVSGASNDCAVCHEETRKEKAPASHGADFALAHGAQAPAGWREGEGGLCALCHAVPQDCTSCHARTKPSSHNAAGFRWYHGRGDTDVLGQPFEETSCATCHEEQGCTLCHQTTRPRSHTIPFQRRLHGIVAEVERQSCMTCHKQDQCDRCHNTTKPISHRGTFGSGPQAHCLVCHDPLPANGCYTCHRNTLGHLQATPLPPGLPHATATDCRTCHGSLPHFDDGGSCRRCHR